ncbi:MULTISPECIES: hypothetical protein [Paenibacillus]|uniref:Uncharacterized protein n=1 Tax=Paenibacillus naphthalenovorans TaxID=162209 RepID=A0A0U2U2P1_9BACL|nr:MULTISPECIES: hypothetical protein [Paenibacillus]ALS20584.1 hypothetical protein IJ22_01920 [Paenibacillus naphthalenovorans]GCL73140.1 hypothetical protein PN4B1_30760 [Paenibacillus naphthalenovorans]
MGKMMSDVMEEMEITFERAGSYNIYNHLQQGECHMTMKKELIVS